MGYARAQWTALTRYGDDGDLAIDNNISERALRKVVTGRNNWTFCGSDAGGERAAILYSVVATCKAHGIDPWAYLRDVLERMLKESNDQYLRHGISVELTDDAKEYVLHKGFEPRFGARPLRQQPRCLQSYRYRSLTIRRAWPTHMPKRSSGRTWSWCARTWC